MYQGSLKGVSRKSQKSFKEVSSVFRESSKGISRMFQGCLKGDGRVFQESFQCVTRVFERSSKGIS